MSVYAVGDIQGCHPQLQRLLDKLHFDPAADQLWVVGDLVNRGPDSLAVLRFIRSLGDSVRCVLGNHDLHLHAVALGHRQHCHRNDTIDEILTAPDRDELLHWLRQQPMMHSDDSIGYHMIHAGLPPQWDKQQAMSCAREVEQALRADNYADYFSGMYGNDPVRWSNDLSGMRRLRFITNCFTRLRYCTHDGELDLEEKGAPGTQKAGSVPWFEVPDRRSADMDIVFGHWSTLGFRNEHGVVALDTGCLWGGSLTAVKLDNTRHRVSIDCPGAQPPDL